MEQEIEMKRVTKFILNNPHFHSALIAILTSAVVSLILVAFSEWILCSLVFTIVAITHIIFVLRVSQSTKSRELELIVTNKQSVKTLEDAFKNIVNVYYPEVSPKEIEKRLIRVWIVIVLSIVIAVFSAFKGVSERENRQIFRQVKANSSIVDSLFRHYDSQDAERELRLEEKIEELSTTISTMQESMDALEKSVKSSRK